MKGKGRGKRAARTMNKSGGCCAEFEEWVMRFVDGELESEQRRQLLIHIQSCYNCARLVRSLKRTVHFCQLEPGWEVPEPTHRRLWERLKEILSRKGSK